MIDSSNLTHEECFRLNGSLSAARINEMLDTHSAYESATECKPCIQEARGSYPAEDFLSGVIEKLNDLRKHLRGDNREALGTIIESLDDLAQTTFYGSEYGRAELDKALEAMP